MKPKTAEVRMTPTQLEYCKKITKKIFDYPIAGPFRQPVNESDEGCKNYRKKIHKPMDLSKVLVQIESGFYLNTDKWKEDMNRIWNNAMKFNEKGSSVYAIAEELQEVFKEKSKFIPKNSYEVWALKALKKQQKIAKILASKPPNLNEKFIPATFPNPDD